MRFFGTSLLIVSFLCVTTGGVLAAEKADIIVAKSGGDFTTIQAAINSVSATNKKNVTILVKNGTYTEHLFINKSYLSIVGESREKTIIQFSIQREQWAADHNKSNVGCAVLNLGCTPELTTAAVSDIVIGNLTIENTYDTLSAKTMTIKDEGNSVRVFVVNCNVWAKGHDTISLWNKSDGMYYHSDCSFKGALDYVCPRGWCYIVNSVFYNTASSAPLWHQVFAGSSQKFTVRTGTFYPAAGFTGTIKLLNQNTSAPIETRFILLDCLLSDKITTEGAHSEAYYFNCHGETKDLSWYKDNLTTFSGAPTQDKINAKWTFDNKWDPENTMPSVLPFSAIPQPWNNAYGLTSTVQLKWINGRNADQNAVYFGTSSTPPFVKTQTENTYTPANLISGKYYWRVDAISGTDTVKGTVWSFTVDKGVSVKDADIKMLNSNNNFIGAQSNGFLMFNYTLNQNEIVTIKLFNLQGKEITSLPAVSRSAGIYSEKVQIEKYGLSKGKYIANLNAGSISKTEEFTLQ